MWKVDEEMLNLRDIELYGNKSGIYYILEEKSLRIYVGSSVNIRRRVRQHANDLLTGSHKNSYLQRVWDKNSPGTFTIGILEIVQEKENLLKREQYWMDFFRSYKREKGFNLAPRAESNLGIKKTLEQIENNKKALQGKRDTIVDIEDVSSIKEEINKGFSLIEIAKRFNYPYEAITSIRKNRSFSYINPQIEEGLNKRNKLKEEDVIFIKKEINKGEKVKDLAEEFKVSHRTISAIKNELTWKNVGEKITIKKRKSVKSNERSSGICD